MLRRACACTSSLAPACHGSAGSRRHRRAPRAARGTTSSPRRASDERTPTSLPGRWHSRQSPFGSCSDVWHVRASGLRQIVASRAGDLGVARNVGGSGAHRCHRACGDRGGRARLVDACCLERGGGHEVPRVGMAARACRLVDVLAVRKAVLGRLGHARVAANAPGRRHVRRGLAGEADVATEVRAHFAQRDELVLKARGKSCVDVATYAGDVRVWPCRPRVVVRRHLMTGGAEHGSVGVESGGGEGDDRQEDARDEPGGHPSASPPRPRTRGAVGFTVQRFVSGRPGIVVRQGPALFSVPSEEYVPLAGVESYLDADRLGV